MRLRELKTKKCDWASEEMRSRSWAVRAQTVEAASPMSNLSQPCTSMLGWPTVCLSTRVPIRVRLQALIDEFGERTRNSSISPFPSPFFLWMPSKSSQTPFLHLHGVVSDCSGLPTRSISLWGSTLPHWDKFIYKRQMCNPSSAITWPIPYLALKWGKGRGGHCLGPL